jgi:predicted dehydrogenase
MGLRIGVVGAGQFAPSFVPLALAHPEVDEVTITDLLPERSTELAERFHLPPPFPSYHDMLASDIDAVALFTQRWTHASLALQALEAGRHVYSTPPMGVTVEEIAAIIAAVRDTRLIYQMAETSYYYPSSVFCRQKVADGAFGRICYAEGDYLHDMDLGFSNAFRHSGGAHWKSTASWPPMLYSNHSVGNVLSVWEDHATAVSCIGVTDRHDDGIFDERISRWNNEFSNAAALFTMSDGGILRANEMRRVGYPSQIRESRLRIFGTEASFEQLATVDLWQTKTGVCDVTPQLKVARLPVTDVPIELGGPYASRLAPVHDSRRLPRSYAHAPNGHQGSHQFLADDFFRAIVSNSQPPVDAWTAARYTLPGIVAHQSAKSGGRQLPIPDYGDPPHTNGPAAVDSLAASEPISAVR